MIFIKLVFFRRITFIDTFIDFESKLSPDVFEIF